MLLRIQQNIFAFDSYFKQNSSDENRWISNYKFIHKHKLSTFYALIICVRARARQRIFHLYLKIIIIIIFQMHWFFLLSLVYISILLIVCFYAFKIEMTIIVGNWNVKCFVCSFFPLNDQMMRINIKFYLSRTWKVKHWYVFQHFWNVNHTQIVKEFLFEIKLILFASQIIEFDSMHFKI